MNAMDLSTLIYAALFAAFVSFMRILSQRPGDRPLAWQALGRIGIAAVAGYIIGSIAINWTEWPKELIWSAAAIAGFLGDSTFFVVATWIDRRYGTDIMGTHRDN